MKNDNAAGRPWAVLLAGGEGSRMKPFVTRWLGRHRPKQYCAFSGGRTMLDHTVDRALDLAPAERVVTVVGKGHLPYLMEQGGPRVPGLVIEQPENAETAPGLFLPLAFVLAADPHAVVAVLPSDHFIRPRGLFSRRMRRALELAASLEDRVLLLAARADRPETEYGWIEAGAPCSLGLYGPRAVARFHEKPGPGRAGELLGRGALWNTMIMAGRAQAFWDMGRRLQPELMDRFELLRAAARLGRGHEALGFIYDGMPKLNFSKDLLERAPERAAVLPLDGVDWCDWGRPERILETLGRLGLQPRFPRELAEEPILAA